MRVCVCVCPSSPGSGEAVERYAPTFKRNTRKYNLRREHRRSGSGVGRRGAGWRGGRVIHAINTDELQELEYVLKLRCILGKNDMVETIENCASRHMMLVIKGETLEESKKNYRDFQSKLNVSYYT